MGTPYSCSKMRVCLCIYRKTSNLTCVTIRQTCTRCTAAQVDRADDKCAFEVKHLFQLIFDMQDVTVPHCGTWTNVTCLSNLS